MNRPLGCAKYGSLFVFTLFVISCGRADLFVRVLGKNRERGVDVSCIHVPPECQVKVEVFDQSRRQSIYQGRGDFTIGLVEAAWAKGDERVDLLVCDRSGEPVILRHDYRTSRTDTLSILPDDIVKVLGDRYQNRRIENKDQWGVPRWACSDGVSSVNEFLDKIGKSRELVYYQPR